MLVYRPGETVQFGLSVNNGAGVAVNADSTPTVTVYRNNAAEGSITPTVSNLTTGAYSVSYAIPTGWAAGDLVQELLTATVSGSVSRSWREAFRISGYTLTQLTDDRINNLGDLTDIGTNLTLVHSVTSGLAADINGVPQGVWEYATRTLSQAVTGVTLTAGEYNNIANKILTGSAIFDGKTLEQAIEIIAAAVAGKLSGAGTSTITVLGLDGSTTRITITTDGTDRTAVTYT